MRETLVKTEEFKDSPVARIPKDWQVVKLLDHVSLPNGQLDPKQKPYCDWILIAPDHIESETGRLLNPQTAAEQNAISGKYGFQPGDVLYSKIRPYLRKAVLAEREGLCSADMYPLRPGSTIVPRFLLAVILGEDFSRFATAVSMRSGFPKLNREELGEYRLALPPYEEQKRIAGILDTVDKAIAHTSSLIAKLKQMKAGLLHDLLTLGLDENGELRDAIAHPEQFKDSPLGRITKDWLVVSVGECLARIEQGWSPDCESNSTPLGEWGVLKTTAVVWEGYQDFENKQLPSHLQPDPNYEVKPGDVLMTRAGPNSRVGVVALVRQTQGKLMLSDKLYRLIPRDCIKPDFLAYTLSGNQTQRHLSTLKTGLAESQTNISQEIVRTLLIALPKIQEQERIISILDTHDTYIRIEEAYHEKLKLQKQGLMHDLLTGRVRVKI